MKTFHTSLLDKQIIFEKTTDQGGVFVYYRKHLPAVSCLPSGETTAAARLHKQAIQLQKMPKTLQFLNYNLASDYINKKSV